MTRLLEQGALKPVVDQTFPLERIVEAHAYVEAGHKRGNVVISIARPPEATEDGLVPN
ncbi:MAG: zinc-binding dehydrogenase [Archangium sp.]|nr:zinc-binding dehydrogenase [Archangium sp.]